MFLLPSFIEPVAGGLAEAIEPVFLGSLTSLHIDWEYLSVVRRMADSTVDGQVTLTIHKYVADYATDAEFGVAAEVLTMTHWAEIVVVEDEFWGTPGKSRACPYTVR